MPDPNGLVIKLMETYVRALVSPLLLNRILDTAPNILILHVCSIVLCLILRCLSTYKPTPGRRARTLIIMACLFAVLYFGSRGFHEVVSESCIFLGALHRRSNRIWRTTRRKNIITTVLRFELGCLVCYYWTGSLAQFYV